MLNLNKKVGLEGGGGVRLARSPQPPSGNSGIGLLNPDAETFGELGMKSGEDSVEYNAIQSILERIHFIQAN